MANITPISTLPTERSRRMLALLLSTSPFFQFIERRGGFELAATDFDLYPNAGESDPQKRGVGTGYSQRSETPPSRESETLGFHGDRITIDRSHLADDRQTLRPIQTWVPKRLRKKVRHWAKGVEKLAFQGSGVDDNTGREVMGLLTLLDGTNVPGFSKPMVIDAADFVSADVNHLDLTKESHRKAFRRALEQILPNYDNPGLLCNRQLASTISGIAQDARRYDTDPDDIFGMVERVFGFELVRLVDGTITNTEPDNASTPNNVTTSLVIASPEEGQYSVATNSGLYVKDELDDVPDADNTDAGREIEWEMRFENAVQDEYVLLRIRNIKVAPGSDVYGDFGA